MPIWLQHVSALLEEMEQHHHKVNDQRNHSNQLIEGSRVGHFRFKVQKE